MLCEKMMAWDVDGCGRMHEAARKSGRVLEIGYQRFYNPVYQAAYEGIVKAGRAGRGLPRPARVAPERHLAAPGRPALARTTTPRAGAIPRFDHLINWRLFWKYSQGLMRRAREPPGQHRQLVLRGQARGRARLGRRLPLVNEGREVPDHVYAHVRVPGRAHRRLHLDRVERLRQLLRGLLRAPRARSS